MDDDIAGGLGFWLLIGIGAGIYGLSRLFAGLGAPLAGLVVWFGRHGPWPGSWVAFGGALAAFFVVRVLAAPVIVRLLLSSVELSNFLQDFSFSWPGVRAAGLALMLAVLDGITLFLITGALAHAGDTWGASGAWLPGSGWGEVARGFSAIGLFAAGTVLTLVAVWRMEGDYAGRIDLDTFFATRWPADFFIYLPVAVGLAFKFADTPVLLTAVLAFAVVRLGCDLVLLVIARRVE